jgi:hypothetical protein
MRRVWRILPKLEEWGEVDTRRGLTLVHQQVPLLPALTPPVLGHAMNQQCFGKNFEKCHASDMFGLERKISKNILRKGTDLIQRFSGKYPL